LGENRGQGGGGAGICFAEFLNDEKNSRHSCTNFGKKKGALGVRLLLFTATRRAIKGIGLFLKHSFGSFYKKEGKRMKVKNLGNG